MRKAHYRASADLPWVVCSALAAAVMVWRLRRLWARVGDSCGRGDGVETPKALGESGGLLALVFAQSRTLIMRAWDLMRVRESIRDSRCTCARSGTFEVSEKVWRLRRLWARVGDSCGRGDDWETFGAFF